MFQLQKIKRKNLDLEKYSKALNESLNYRIYAEHWYLDLLTDEKWECWVYGDYEVIMPIPLQYKFGIKFVLQPIYCQQLGVFYREEISDELFKEFESKLHKYRVRAYHFNEENTERYEPEGVKRVNYVLDLNRPYEEVVSSFSKSTKWNLKQFSKSNKEVLNENISNFNLMAFKKENSKFNFSSENLLRVLRKSNENNRLEFKTIVENSEIQAFGAFLSSKSRIIYINSASNNFGKKIAAPTGILTTVMKEHSEQHKSIDFEGSSNSKIAYFFSGFGAEEKFYIRYSNSR